MAVQQERLESLAVRLRDLSKEIVAEGCGELSPTKGARVRRTITEAYDRLREVVESLDPVRQPDFVFDPTNPNVAGRIAGITLIAQEKRPLADIGKFYGSGVYALYYGGPHPAYSPISKTEHPIYVGKADPEDPASATAMQQGNRLASRLGEHRKTIIKASATLDVSDFSCRALVVKSGWQSSAEEHLIRLFRPIWNSQMRICFGFGKHGDAPDTRANLRSPWDTLHPGRDWAHRTPTAKDAKPINDAKPESQILAEISQHFAKYRPLGAVAEIVERFLAEMREA